MKKTIAVVLALAVIFGFVACEATTQTLYGRVVSNVTVASAPAYFEGETINPADIQIRIQYEDGSATISGDEAGMIPADKDYIANADSTKFTVSYGSQVTSTGTVALKWDVYVPTVKATGLTIGTANAKHEITPSEIDAVPETGLVYTLAYNGGSKEVTAAVAKARAPYSLSYDTDNATIEGETSSFPVKVTANTDVPVTLAEDWIVTLVEDTSKAIKSIELVPSTDQEFFEINGSWKKTHNGQLETGIAKLSDVDYTIKATLNDGTTVEFDEKEVSSGVYPTLEEGEAYVVFTANSPSTELKGADNFAATVTYKNNGKVESEDVTLKVPYVVDYVLKYKVEGVPGKTYSIGEEILEGQFNYTATEWASGYKDYRTENNLDASNFEIKENYVPNGYTGQANMPINVELKADCEARLKGATCETTGLTVTVKNIPTTTPGGESN